MSPSLVDAPCCTFFTEQKPGRHKSPVRLDLHEVLVPPGGRGGIRAWRSILARWDDHPRVGISGNDGCVNGSCVKGAIPHE